MVDTIRYYKHLISPELRTLRDSLDAEPSVGQWTNFKIPDMPTVYVGYHASESKKKAPGVVGTLYVRYSAASVLRGSNEVTAGPEDVLQVNRMIEDAIGFGLASANISHFDPSITLEMSRGVAGFISSIVSYPGKMLRPYGGKKRGDAVGIMFEDEIASRLMRESAEFCNTAGKIIFYNKFLELLINGFGEIFPDSLRVENQIEDNVPRAFFGSMDSFHKATTFTINDLLNFEVWKDIGRVFIYRIGRTKWAKPGAPVPVSNKELREHAMRLGINQMMSTSHPGLTLDRLAAMVIHPSKKVEREFKREWAPRMTPVPITYDYEAELMRKLTEAIETSLGKAEEFLSSSNIGAFLPRMGILPKPSLTGNLNSLRTFPPIPDLNQPLR